MIALRLLFGALAGLVIGWFAAMAFGTQWSDYLRGEPLEWGGLAPLMMVLFVVITVMFCYQVVMMQYAISPALRLHRSIIAVYGSMLVGLAVATVLTRALYGLLVDVGQLGRSYGPDPARPWTTAHWVVHTLPLVIAGVCVVAGVVMVAVGLRGASEVSTFNTEGVHRRRGGRKFDGRIVAADAVPGRPDLTRVVGEFAAPDGIRQVAATVEGDQRDWLPGAKAHVHVDVRRPYDPAGILLVGRTFTRAQGFLVDQVMPPVGSRGTATLR